MKEKDIVALWKKISNVISEEIQCNPKFAEKISEVIALAKTDEEFDSASREKPIRRNRRNPARLDPFVLLKDGETALLEGLRGLSVEELKDIIAAYGMDPTKLAMKWKSREKLEQHIIEVTIRKSGQGDAFWNAGNTDN